MHGVHITATLTLRGDGNIGCINGNLDDFIIRVGSDVKSGTLSISGSTNIISSVSNRPMLGVFGNGSEIVVDDDALLRSDVSFIDSNQNMHLRSDTKYEGSVFYKGNSIKFGGKDGYEPKQDDFITFINTSISTGDHINIKGSFRSQTLTRLVQITNGEVTGNEMKISNDIKFIVSEDSTLITESAYVGGNSQLLVEGKVIVKGTTFSNYGKIVVDKGVFDLKGTVENYGEISISNSFLVNGKMNNFRSIIINANGTLEIEDGGRIQSEVVNEDISNTICNNGRVVNKGLVTIGVDASFDNSSGSLCNEHTMCIDGTIIGNGSSNMIVNNHSIELNGYPVNVWIDNAQDMAEVKLISISRDEMTIINSIGVTGSDNSMVRIEAGHSVIKGLKVISKIKDDKGYLDLSGDVSTEQISPIDYDTEEIDIIYASIHTEGHVSVDESLSVPVGVTLNVGTDIGDHTFTVNGILTTEFGELSIERYKDASRTDTEVVSNIENGGIFLDRVTFTVAGEYVSKGMMICSSPDTELICAIYKTDKINSVYKHTPFSKAFDECSKIGEDTDIWLYGNTSVDWELSIPNNVTIHVMDSINSSVGNISISGSMIFKSKTDGLKSTLVDLTIDENGSIEVLDGAELVTRNMIVLGAISSEGSVSAEKILVGASDTVIRSGSTIRGDGASVSGMVEAKDYWIITDGSKMSVTFNGYGSTSYYVDGKPYITVYAKSPTNIGIITVADLDGVEWRGWYAGDETDTDVSDRLVGNYDLVNAISIDTAHSGDRGIEATDCLMIVVFTLASIAAIVVAGRI